MSIEPLFKDNFTFVMLSETKHLCYAMQETLRYAQGDMRSQHVDI